jgi:hypothetical protein
MPSDKGKGGTTRRRLDVARCKQLHSMRLRNAFHWGEERLKHRSITVQTPFNRSPTHGGSRPQQLSAGQVSGSIRAAAEAHRSRDQGTYRT